MWISQQAIGGMSTQKVKWSEGNASISTNSKKIGDAWKLYLMVIQTLYQEPFYHNDSVEIRS